jgi:hypothetical protein
MAMLPPITVDVKKAASAVSLFLSILVFLHPTDRMISQFAWRLSKTVHSEYQFSAARL